jgi:hypothetical protein
MTLQSTAAQNFIAQARLAVATRPTSNLAESATLMHDCFGGEWQHYYDANVLSAYLFLTGEPGPDLWRTLNAGDDIAELVESLLTHASDLLVCNTPFMD